MDRVHNQLCVPLVARTTANCAETLPDDILTLALALALQNVGMWSVYKMSERKTVVLHAHVVGKLLSTYFSRS